MAADCVMTFLADAAQRLADRFQDENWCMNGDEAVSGHFREEGATALDPDEHPDLFEPTVGYCSKCGDVRSSVYVCRDGGKTVSGHPRDDLTKGTE